MEIKEITRKKRVMPVKYSMKRLEIIEYYLNNNENSQVIIAEKFNVCIAFLGKLLNEYFEDKCVTVESKMNQL